MTIETATLSRKTLRALALAASKNPARYYLQGVLVEIRPKHVTYVATDGHIMLADRLEDLEGVQDNTLLGNFIIPAEVCNDKRLIDKTFDFVTITRMDDKLVFDGAIIFSPIDGVFPDWRRVLPEELSGEVAQYNSALLATLDKAAKIAFGARYANNASPHGTVAHNGGGPAIVAWPWSETFFGIIMPFRRSDGGPPIVPAWVRERA